LWHPLQNSSLLRREKNKRKKEKRENHAKGPPYEGLKTSEHDQQGMPKDLSDGPGPKREVGFRAAK
jgi:hypothetical protein